MTKVKLTYFKPSGKYHSDSFYKTNKTQMYEIFDEVRLLKLCGELPGLLKGTREFVILVEPEHEFAFPALIF